MIPSFFTSPVSLIILTPMSKRHLYIILLAAIFSGSTALAVEPGGTTSPDLKEVLDLVRANLSGVSESELNQAVVNGLTATLRGKVRVSGGVKKAESANTPAIARADVIEESFACLRVTRVDAGLASDIKARIQEINATNKLKGVVFDLRFCDGEDFAAAAAVVDLFVGKDRLLLEWGGGEARSRQKVDAFALPVAVLVNRETVAAPEAMAAVFRETGTGLILGNTTAGAAMVMREFPLKNGQRLLIAGAPVKLADGTELPITGVKPDIQVNVTLDVERAYRDDAYANLATASSGSRSDLVTRTNRRPRVSEADLVREKREGVTLEESASARERGPEKPVLRDPALARAVDVLKGLAVIRKTSL